MKSLHIFVTGGSGFIGRNIVEQLGEKYRFYAPSHRELDLTDEDAVEKFFKMHPIDIVIHSAKVGGTRKVPNTAENAEINMRMFFILARNEEYFKKMIFFGSGAEYDVSRTLKKMKEDDFDKAVPKDSFGFYKYVCSKYIEKAEKIVNLRLFGIYGKYEDYELRFISNAICKNIFALPITIRQNVFFDYVYIDDLIKIIEHFINNDSRNKFYNIGTGKSIDLLSVAKLINKIAGQKSDILIDKKGLKNEYTCDNTRLKNEIKNLHFADIERAIGELYAWYKSIKPTLNRESFLVDK